MTPEEREAQFKAWASSAGESPVKDGTANIYSSHLKNIDNIPYLAQAHPSNLFECDDPMIIQALREEINASSSIKESMKENTLGSFSSALRLYYRFLTRFSCVDVQEAMAKAISEKHKTVNGTEELTRICDELFGEDYDIQNPFSIMFLLTKDRDEKTRQRFLDKAGIDLRAYDTASITVVWDSHLESSITGSFNAQDGTVWELFDLAAKLADSPNELFDDQNTTRRFVDLFDATMDDSAVFRHLSKALYFTAPRAFFPVSEDTEKWVRSNGIPFKFRGARGKQYVDLLRAIHDNFDEPIYELAYEAENEASQQIDDAGELSPETLLRILQEDAEATTHDNQLDFAVTWSMLCTMFYSSLADCESRPCGATDLKVWSLGIKDYTAESAERFIKESQLTESQQRQLLKRYQDSSTPSHKLFGDTHRWWQSTETLFPELAPAVIPLLTEATEIENDNEGLKAFLDRNEKTIQVIASHLSNKEYPGRYFQEWLHACNPDLFPVITVNYLKKDKGSTEDYCCYQDVLGWLPEEANARSLEQYADNVRHIAQSRQKSNSPIAAYSYRAIDRATRIYLSRNKGYDVTGWSEEESSEDNRMVDETDGQPTSNSEQSGPLNLILYGPPGTGKTYATMRETVAICDGKDAISEMSDEEIAKRYKELESEGRIEFVTFHQSFSYEDFVEGIRPAIAKDDESQDGENGTLGYTIEDGVFKAFCDRAYNSTSTVEGLNAAPKIWKVSLQGAGENPIRTDCLQNGYIRIGFDELVPVDGIIPEGTGHGIVDAFYNKMSIGDIVCSCWSQTETDAIGIITGGARYDDSKNEYRLVRNVNWIWKGSEPVDIRELNSGVNMTLSTVYQLRRIKPADLFELVGIGKSKSPAEPYVFIIDEINRGNVAAIFGELMTLLEENKRIGIEEENEEEKRVTLPYSKESFGISSNVYVIATMNTADRSLTQLDTALRRRFEFEEVMPDPSLLSEDIDGVNLQELLKAINERIEVLYDREHTIGHSYLMHIKSLDDLREAFHGKIIPLLQEYFFDDYEKIRAVLNDTDGRFIRKTTASERLGNDWLNAFSDELDIEVDESMYEIVDGRNGGSRWTAGDFMSIYGEDASADPDADDSDEETEAVEEP